METGKCERLHHGVRGRFAFITIDRSTQEKIMIACTTLAHTILHARAPTIEHCEGFGRAINRVHAALRQHRAVALAVEAGGTGPVALPDHDASLGGVRYEDVLEPCHQA